MFLFINLVYYHQNHLCFCKTQALLDLKQWNYKIIYIIQIKKNIYYSKKNKLFYKQML